MMRAAGIKTVASAPLDVARHPSRLGLVLVSSRVQDLVTQSILTINTIYMCRLPHVLAHCLSMLIAVVYMYISVPGYSIVKVSGRITFTWAR